MKNSNFLRSSTVLAILALSLSTATAGELDTYCELASTRAAVQSELLTAPEFISSFGDPVTGASTASIGVRKSISRGKQGNLVTQLGAAECTAYRADRQLSTQLTSAEARAELKALEAKKPLLKDALELAEKNVATEQKLLNSQSSTLADMRGAYDQRDRLRQELATLASRHSMIKDQPPELEVGLEELVNASIAAQSDVADLTAKITAQSGWDVAVSAGVRANLQSNGKTEGYVAMTASRSFGYGNARQAAEQVGALSAKLLREQRDGSYQQLLRTRDVVAGVLAAEKMTVASLTERSAAMTSTMSRLTGIDTTEGLRTQRALAVEVAYVNATLKASEARAAYLAKWAGLNGAK